MSKKLSRAQREKIAEVKERFQAWVAQRMEQNRPISYRMASRLMEAYSHMLGISQNQAQKDLLAWGLDKILIAEPTSSNFPEPGTIAYQHMLALWRRRDLRPL